MQRAGIFVMIVGIGLSITGPSHADIPPPPPPKGLKYVGINHEFKVAPDVKGFVFVEVVSSFSSKTSFRKLTPKPDQAIPISDFPNRRSSVAVYVVKEAFAKKFAKDEALFEAIDDMHANPPLNDAIVPIFMEYQAVIESKDPRKTVKWTNTFKGIEKNKPIIDRKGDGKVPSYDGPDGESAPPDPEEFALMLSDLEESEGSIAAREALLRTANIDLASLPPSPGSRWIPGIASALAISLLGLWVVRRRSA